MPLHPVLAARLEQLKGASDDEYWAGIAEPYGPYDPPPVVYSEAAAPRPDGDGAVPLHVFTAVDAQPGAPALVWCHGGAFVGGAVEMFEGDGVAREVAARTGGVAVSVDYRLATEELHAPKQTDDVETAWRWVYDHADELGIDPGRIAIGGASAGAALTSAVALALRDAGGPLPSLVALAYPLVHATLPPYSHELAAKLPQIPACFVLENVDDGIFEIYLGGPAWTANSHNMAGLCDDLTGYPRTLIINSDYDALRASGQRFAAQLAEAGVDVRVYTEPGTIHGHVNYTPTFEPVEHSLAELAAAVAAA
ncbi:MAG: alpha/beta hydrolase [Bifidobacteriaceae bacterium]|jgi:acetyl esterase/lipase|nr:alpha/beta hydrolase [Bifidobacteriaceae bacterium]